MESRRKQHEDQMNSKRDEHYKELLPDYQEYEEFKEFKKQKENKLRRHLSDNQELFEEFMQEKKKRRRLEENFKENTDYDYQLQPEGDDDIQNPPPPFIPNIDQEQRRKKFEELKDKWKHDEMQGVTTNRNEKVQEITDQFEIVIWGNSHPFYSHWIKQVSESSPNGKLSNTWLQREAKHIGINIQELEEQGVDLQKELLYTGYINYEQRQAAFNVLIRQKYEPFIACRIKQNSNKNIEDL